MIDSPYRLQYVDCRAHLMVRLRELSGQSIQFVTGPRQVGKTTLLGELETAFRDIALYAALDAPEAALPGFFEAIWRRAEQIEERHGRAIVLLDEVQHLEDWSARLKGEWDRLKRRRRAISVVASGSSALQLGQGSRETLAGRFEKLSLAHWSASSLSKVFKVPPREAAEQVVDYGAYPGAFQYLKGQNRRRWLAYVREAIIEPAIGRDILALKGVRRPALLRQVYAVATSMPAQIVALQKLQGTLQDPGALGTLSHYLALLEEAFLIAGLQKHSEKVLRSRAAPPKLVSLSNALVAATQLASSNRSKAEYGRWVENACLAYAWNAGQRVRYWNEAALELDGVLDGSWGQWAIEVTLEKIDRRSVTALGEFTRRFREYQPLVLCEPSQIPVATRFGFNAMDWRDFLISGPPRRQ